MPRPDPGPDAASRWRDRSRHRDEIVILWIVSSGC